MRTPRLLPKDVAAVVKYQKDPIRALEMFNSASKEEGFRHTPLTYKCMIEKLGSFGEFEAMEKIMTDMRMNSDCSESLHEDIYVGTMRNYAKRGKLQEAVNVFERMDFFGCQPSVSSYNSIMNILIEYKYFEQAHKVYLRMLDKGIKPDAHTFTIRIKAFCRTQRPHAALRLLKNMPSQGCGVNAVAYCTVVGGLYAENCKIEALSLFVDMLCDGICPDIATFNKLIHVLCKKGDIRESTRLLAKIFKRSVCPNLFTCNIFMQGLCREDNMAEAHSFLGIMLANGFKPDTVTYNTIIFGLCRSRKIEDAENFLHKMVREGCIPDDFSYNMVITGYCKLERAIDVFREATIKGFKSDVVVCNTVVKSLCQYGFVLEAAQMVDKMLENGCIPNMCTYNIIVSGLCKSGDVDHANNLINDAILRGYLPDVFTFNTLIDGYCKRRELNKALDVIDRMRTHNVTPDVITYNCILNGLSKSERTDDVLEIFEEMVSKDCAPNVITYNILIESLCKGSRVTEACALVDKMMCDGVKPDAITYGTLIHGHSLNGDLMGAYELLKDMERLNISPTTATFNILIRAYCENLMAQKAKGIFNEIIDRGCLPDEFSYRTLIEGFCQAGETYEGYKFIGKMMKDGFIPSLRTFGRVINCLSINNLISEAVGIIHVMVDKGLVPEVVNTIFKADKKDAVAPKILLEELLRKGYITYGTYELLFSGVRDRRRRKVQSRSRIV